MRRGAGWHDGGAAADRVVAGGLAGPRSLLAYSQSVTLLGSGEHCPALSGLTRCPARPATRGSHVHLDEVSGPACGTSMRKDREGTVPELHDRSEER